MMTKIKTFLANLRRLTFSKKDLKKKKITTYLENGLELGQGTFFTAWINIDKPSKTKIGNNCVFADNITILNHDASTTIHLDIGRYSSVIIGDSCFIGYGSIIMPGVNIGDNCIIGSGSVVTKDVPSFSVFAGNPAKKIMDLDFFLEKIKSKVRTQLNLNETSWEDVLKHIKKNKSKDYYLANKYIKNNSKTN